MIRRLRVKFVCVNMAIVAAMLCVIFGMVLHFTRESLRDESRRLLESIAQDPLAPERPGRRTQPYFILEFWPGGVRLTTGGGYYSPSDEELLELFSAASQAGTPEGVLADYALRFRRLESRVGFAFVDISGEVSAMEHLVQNCMATGAVSLGAFLLVSMALARWAVRPVDEAWKRQRQFVADASHELKTPLTVILTNAELLQDPKQEGRTRFAENILVMARQMRGLVESLLDLARVDGGIVERVLEPVDLSRLAAEALLPFEPVFFEKGLDLQSEVEEGVAVRGSGAHLRQAVDILLDNAGKYAVPPGNVTLRLRRSGGRACLLSVASPGETIPERDLRRIFERFCRLDEARARDGSCGLGLSIAQGIVEAHGGRIWAESGGGTNTFFIRLPLLREK